jgi:hypothetical protein
VTSSPRKAILATSQRTRLGMVSARTVGSFVPKLTQKAFEKYGFSTVALLTDWTAIAGKDLAAYTLPERIKWPRNVPIREDVEGGCQGRPGACLILRVDPARALDVQYSTAQLLERINGYFGYRAVADLRILQAPLDPIRKPQAHREQPRSLPPANAALVKTPMPVPMVADEALKAALMRLQEGFAREPAG